LAFPQVQTVNLDTLISTTLQNYLPEMVVNVIEDCPSGKYFLDKVGKSRTGGTRITPTLRYGANSTVTFFNTSDYIDLSPQEAATQAQYKWANLVGAISIFGEEEYANAGKAQLFDFAKTKIDQLQDTLSRRINQATYGDGTANFGAAPDGLSNLVYATATPANPPGGAVGGISATAFSFWRNSANLAPGAYSANGPMGTAAIDYQDRMWDVLTDGNKEPTAIFSDFGSQEAYKVNAGTKYRVVESSGSSPQSSLDLGFTGIVYKNKPWYRDRDCPTGTMYIVNGNYLYGVKDSSRWFKPTEWMPTMNQDGKVMRVHCRYNMICDNRMLQGVITNWS